MKPKTRVYLLEEASARMLHLAGRHAASVADMTTIGIPVPPGFVLTTEACNAYFASNAQLPSELWEEVLQALKIVENRTGKSLGSEMTPLLLQVDCSPLVHVPGLMPRVSYVGLNRGTVAGLSRLVGDEQFAWKAYCQFLKRFAEAVLKIDLAHFRLGPAGCYDPQNRLQDEPTAEEWQALAEQFEYAVRVARGADFPDDPYDQLRTAVAGAFESWNDPLAAAYRESNEIPHNMGTAASVVTMIFGNSGERSGSGVVLTRNALTGEQILCGEFLVSGHCEDVVAAGGTRRHISVLAKEMPDVYNRLREICRRVEHRYKDMQRVEFTVERGNLWVHGSTSGAAIPRAAIAIATDLAEQGVISKEEALLRIDPSQLTQLIHPYFAADAKRKAYKADRMLVEGLGASPGAVSGLIVLDTGTAQTWAREGKPVILVRSEITPEDLTAIPHVGGVVTSRGGLTSHAAVVSRALGKPYIASCRDLEVDAASRSVTTRTVTVHEGKYVSIDGGTGEVFLGHIPTIEPVLSEEIELQKLLSWANGVRRLGVWANADNARDVERAHNLGAQGVGLVRSEHMLLGTAQLAALQRMIVAESEEERQEALDRLFAFQRNDFATIFLEMDGLPVVIRLLDPPLHEFLPSYREVLAELTGLRSRGDVSEIVEEKERLLKAIERMEEANPMLGLRGVRLSLLLPQISTMQVRAIFEAACDAMEEGVTVHPRIVVPFTSHAKEFEIERNKLEREAKNVLAKRSAGVEYKFGTMIETPRAAITALEMAKSAEFFSFGTNDLTQTVFAMSRDDAEREFLLKYIDEGILPHSPFEVLDQEGVGFLIELAIRLGRETRPSLEVGVCGEHGADPKSIQFFHRIGVDYVSCSPLRVPIARLAAAQAALLDKEAR